MAKKTDKEPTQQQLPPGARSFSRTGDSLTTFVEGETIRGAFVHVKEVTIKDKRTREPKTIRIYVMQLEDGSMARIGSRALLDDAFDEVCGVVGGWEKLVGKDIAFIRGEDAETSEGNPLGTYQIILYN
jgi:hypothetical protein